MKRQVNSRGPLIALLLQKLNGFKRYALGLFGFLLHCAFFFFIVAAVNASHDPEASMGYYAFVYVDYPVSTFAGGLPGIFLFGGLLWFLYGFTLQAIFSCRKWSDLLWLAPPVGVLAFMFAIPWLMLLSLPKWQQEWTLGTSAANSGDSAGAVRRVSEAIRLASPDDNLTYGISEYLGNVLCERHEYDQAEKAFLSYLSLALEQSASRTNWDLPGSDTGPGRVLAAYRDLSQLYNSTGDSKKQKSALLEEIKWSRVYYRGDSLEEAVCWSQLARISYEEGDRKSGIEFMEKAIAMEAATHTPADTFWQEELANWKVDQ